MLKATMRLGAPEQRNFGDLVHLYDASCEGRRSPRDKSHEPIRLIAQFGRAENPVRPESRRYPADANLTLPIGGLAASNQGEEGPYSEYQNSSTRGIGQESTVSSERINSQKSETGWVLIAASPDSRAKTVRAPLIYFGSGVGAKMASSFLT
jgi:hypothetical protein